MENTQHKKSGELAAGNESRHSFQEKQPGQQVPASDNRQDLHPKENTAPKDIHHSDSSFPQQDNETLGTP